jgi:Mce-associated membrane protein
VADKTGGTAEETREMRETADTTGMTGEESTATVSATAEETGDTAHESDEAVAETAQESGETGHETAAEPGGTGTHADDGSAAGTDGAANEETPKDADAPVDAVPADAKSGTGASRTGASRTRLAAVVLGAATVVLGGFGVWATVAAHNLRSSAAPQNIAVTNGAATSAVSQQIAHAVNTVFSYNYADTAATRQAAQSLLTGPAIRQYNTYFTLVAKDAPTQKLVVTTRVTNSGVELLDGNQARLLVFANQQDTRAGTHQTSYAGALFAVTAIRQGGRWKIENIDTFSGPQ